MGARDGWLFCRRGSAWLGRALGVVALVLLGCLPQSLQSASASVQVTTSDAEGRIALGDRHTCAISNDNTLWCWGENSFLQLGVTLPGNQTFATTPVQSATLPNARRPVQVVAGSLHTCVRASDGTVWCWGDDGYGALGSGGSGTSEIPQQVSLPAAATKIAAGGSTTCAVLHNKALYCWGRNQVGQVGIGSTVTPQTTPQHVTLVPSTFEVSDIEVGGSHTCAVSTVGAAWCWGSYASGQLGNSATSDALLPVATAALGGSATSVSAGGAHSCVVMVDHNMKCFGSNAYGQLGQSLSTASTSTPTAVTVGENVDVVTAGLSYTCVLTSTGVVKCFGRNQWGQLASGATSTTPRVEAMSVLGLASDRAVQVVAGSEHACAVMETGVVKCWGDNTYGQVGINNGEQPQPSATTVGVLNVVPTTTTLAPTTPIPSPSVSPATLATTVPPLVTVGTTISPSSVPQQAALDSTPTPATVVTTSQTQNRSTKKPLVRPVSLRRGSHVSASTLASAVSMVVPKTSQGSMRIVIVTGVSRCVFRGSTILGIRPGQCTVAITLMPKKGPQTTRRTTITVR